MSNAATESPVEDSFPPEEGESEESKYRSYREDSKKKAKAKQEFKVGRTVWFKTDHEGSYRMTVTEAAHDPVAYTWSYKLKDSMGEDYEGWVAETKLTRG